MSEEETHEVYLVTASPLPGSPGPGTLDWHETQAKADETFAEFVNEYGTTDTIALWKADIPDEWDDEDTTLYLAETFGAYNTPEEQPIRTHNAPSES